MSDIGVPTPKGTLFLPTVGDFIWSFSVEGDPLPAGSELMLLLGNPPTPSVRWDFVVSGGSASIKVESDEVASVAQMTKWWLVLVTDPVDPDTRIELATGMVKKVNA